MVRFSVVYPTRDRPALLEAGLKLLSHQTSHNFEILVSDNPSDESFSVKDLCARFGELNIVYMRTPRELSMTENWNHALKFCSGSYVLYLTDKMALLPNTLEVLETMFGHFGPQDIVSWPSDAYTPTSFNDYLGPGTYSRVIGWSNATDPNGYRRFHPRKELERRLRGRVSRVKQTPHDYARGKIVFGAFSMDLIGTIQEKHGQLFWPGSPDYTSMVLGLGTASNCVELERSGVVSLNTDISNGELNATNDGRALTSLGRVSNGLSGIMDELMIPGLYSSQHAVVATDYVEMMSKLKSPLRPSSRNWTKHSFEDLNRKDRVWSSPEARKQQFDAYRKFVRGLRYLDRVAIYYFELVSNLRKEANEPSPVVNAKRLIAKILIRLQTFGVDKPSYFHSQVDNFGNAASTISKGP